MGNSATPIKKVHYHTERFPKYGAFAVIFDEQRRVLLNHRTDRDAWDLPGGGVEFGESPWQAVVREVKEETGLNVEVVRLSGIYHFPAFHELTFVFECRVVGGSLKDTDEAEQHTYFPVSGIPENTVHSHKQRIKDAASSSETIFRQEIV